MLKLIAIKTDKGYHITDNIQDESWNHSSIECLKFDGKKAKKAFYKDWFIIEKEPKLITETKSQVDINRRYELRDKNQFSNLKETYKEEEILIDGEYVDEFFKIKSLYGFKSDGQEPIDDPREFEFTILAEMKKIPGRTLFEYEIQRTQWSHEGTMKLRNSGIYQNILDKIVTPPILRHTKPCSLTSRQSYKIVRQYIKQNIDLTVAEITSDHNFCFGVCKIIKFDEAEKYTMVHNFFSKKKTKYTTKYRNSRQVEIFEMTYSPECYDRYTPIEGFKGKNEKDLKKNVDKYLKNLIARINEPLVECSHCKGMGVILQEI